MIVYVITPSLNKSFKFQSDWPNNNSQSYLLTSVAKDLKDDSAYKFTQKDKDYIFTTKTNYPNNPKYVKQNIILDKKFDLKKVEVKDDQDITYIEFTVKSLDKKANFSEDEFSLEEITKDFETQEESDNNINNNENNTENENSQESETNQNNNSNQTESDQNSNETNESEEPSNTNETESTNDQTENSNTNETSKVDENVFPLYLPSNTSLSDKEVIETTNGERVIMTFSGDNPFILVQETVKPSKELEIIPTYGEPFMLIDTVGSLTDTSYTWTSNGVEYYIVSDQMDQTELLEVAKSINIVSTINEK
ncbi:MAG: outer membrane lipoprotein carrier protein LolA [Bacilli bacterium]